MRFPIASTMTLWGFLTAALGVSVYAAGTADSNLTTKAKTPHGQPDFTFDQLYKLQTRFLDNFITASNTSQAQLVNSTLLAENVQVCPLFRPHLELIRLMHLPGPRGHYPHL